MVKGVIFDDPTDGCILKSSRESWLGLPKSKSLFYSGADKGLPIGNLTSQLFANIYLDSVDQFIKRQLKFRYYGRYVDDMVIVSGNKQRLLEAVEEISDYLYENLSLKLHPKKIYLQHVSKGVNFLGVYIKPYRVLVGKRVADSVRREMNNEMLRWKETAYKNNVICMNEINVDFCHKMNSYLGLLRQSNSYKFRKKLHDTLTLRPNGRLTTDEQLRKIVVVKPNEIQ